MNYFTQRFHQQVAVITGGADGLGLSIAKRLHAEGADVWLFDRDQEKLESAQKQFSERMHIQQVDISNEDSVRHGFEAVHNSAQRLDVCINSAGIVGPNGKNIEDVSLSEYTACINVNLVGSFLVTKYAIPLMKKRDYGRILLIASIAGKDGNAGMCAYSSSKAGVIGLVKSVGKEYAQTGITINGLAPAVVKTALVESMDPKQVEYMTSRIPMNRLGTLEEVAATACFIVSEETAFQTAFTWDISGGRAVY